MIEWHEGSMLTVCCSTTIKLDSRHDGLQACECGKTTAKVDENGQLVAYHNSGSTLAVDHP